MFSQLRYVQEQLDRVGYKGWKDIEEKTGVPVSTLKKIGYRQTPTPRSDTVDKIATYFRTQERRKK